MDNLEPGDYTFVQYKSPVAITYHGADWDWQTAILHVMWFEMLMLSLTVSNVQLQPMHTTTGVPSEILRLL